MSDEWKGEGFIRAKRSKDERRVDDQRVIQSAVHKLRQKRGENVSVSGAPWAKTISAWYKHGKIIGGHNE